MPGLPKLAWQTAIAFLVLGGGFWALSCYGKQHYDDGRRESEVARTDSVRVAMTHAIDSAQAAMLPTLEALRLENDSLRTENRRARLSAVASATRARRSEALLIAVADSAGVPPRVRELIDSMVVSSAALRASVETLTVQNIDLETAKVRAVVEAEKWAALQHQTWEALNTAALEVEQLKRRKDAPRHGFKAGLVTGLLTAAAVVVTILGVAR